MTVTIAKDERVVLITGCSAGGIGHHLALELAAHGCRVFAGVRTLSKAQTLVDNPRIEAVELDITDDASVDAAVAYVLAATGGRIDMLVNNAGIHCVGPTVELPLSQVQQVFNTNFIGMARLCRAVAPVMMDRRQGTIVNVGSASGYVATPWVGIYAATKAAVHAYSDSLRVELAPFGVNVVVVAAGCVKSNIVDNYSEPLLDDNNTRYTMARPAIEEKFGLSQVEGVTPTSQLAHVVVPKILRCSPPAYITYDNPLIEAVELDVTDDASVDAAVAYVLAATGGRIDMLVNNAGINCAGPTVEIPLSQVHQVFNTNFIGLARLCRTVAPVMMDRRQGTIVNVGSVSGYTASPWFGYYTATKAAAHAYSDSLRMELAPFGVSVVVVAPGRIKSNIVDNYTETLLDGNNTRYTMARPAIEKAVMFSQTEGATPASQFASVVVPKLLHRSPPAYITYGDASSSIWCMYYVPPVILDYLLGSYFGTHQLAKDLQSPSLSSPATTSVVVWVALAAAALGILYTFF
ncbi:hypothetical protein H4R27_004284 [Coemansia aciculifera]|nr:hypothetical protein H4R27_004284 [Coemansia aciculifera]